LTGKYSTLPSPLKSTDQRWVIHELVGVLDHPLEPVEGADGRARDPLADRVVLRRRGTGD
jgi:hypothetical protein